MLLNFFPAFPQNKPLLKSGPTKHRGAGGREGAVHPSVSCALPPPSSHHTPRLRQDVPHAGGVQELWLPWQWGKTAAVPPWVARDQVWAGATNLHPGDQAGAKSWDTSVSRSDEDEATARSE